MYRKNLLKLTVIFYLLPAIICLGQTARLTVDVKNPRHKVSPMLWGIFFEDINLSADGGIYPEFVRNRSFEDSNQPDYWQLVIKDGQAQMTIDTSAPVNPFNRRSLRLSVDGQAVLINRGYWGMNVVKGHSYEGSLAARAADGITGPLTVALVSSSGRILASGQIPNLGQNWRYYHWDSQATDTDPNAFLSITVKGKGVLWLDMVSVMPAKTWKGHGLRVDLCQMLEGLKPSFMRFPGGCWVEGDDMAHMYNWKHTIGQIAHRRPLWNLWGYWATHGLGFHEYLQLAEDLGAEPVFCINCGMSHREVVPLDQMGQWVQDALDAIEYANGPVDSVWGSLRAKNGHPKPFNLKYIQIGNENGGPAYNQRWQLFHKAIKAKYPQIQLIACVWGGYPKDPAADIIDEHYYNNPEFFMLQSHRYDTYDRKGPKIFVGEYAVTSGAGGGNLRGAIGEAAFMTGIERNCDIVVMASYAPLFVNVNHKRWPINLINFDSSRVFGLPSYYVQQMFSQNRGTRVLPIDVDSPDVTSRPKGGTIGVGTWLTQAEFKDITVTSGDQVLYQSDFSEGTKGWRFLGDGNWSVQDSALRQMSLAENVRAILPGRSWTEYTYSLKARKISGAEGFLILFNVQDEQEKSWWNIGGWGNDHHAVEMGGVISNEVKGGVQAGRWYDIRIEVKGDRIRCFLDGRLIHDLKAVQTVKAIYASATIQEQSNEVILKVVNTAYQQTSARCRLAGLPKGRKAARIITLTSDDPRAENSLERPNAVVPVEKTMDIDVPEFTYTFPANSVTVMRVPM